MRFGFLVTGLFLASPLAAQETSVTIYSDGRLLVRRSIPVAVVRGANTVAADLGVRELEAGSLVSLDSGVQIVGARVSSAVGLEGSLRRAIGSDLFFRVGSDTVPRYVRARVLSVDPPAVRLDGNVQYGWPGTPVFPDSLVQLSPHYELTLEASRAANAIRLLYLSSGLSWRASYSVMLPRGGVGEALVSGTAELDNQRAISLNGVRVQLLAGDVRAADRFSAPSALQRQVVAGEIVVSAPAEEGVGGVHLYTLPGTVNFVPGETRTIALFVATTVQVSRELALTGGGYGLNAQWPEAQHDLHPGVTYRLHRPANSAFGDTPVPAGTLRLYEPDSSGRRQMVGEIGVNHTPAGRDITAMSGTDFDVTAQRTQTEFQRTGNREVTSGYTVELQNAKPEPVEVLVSDMCPGRCDVLASSVPLEQQAVSAANVVEFRVNVPANGSATLTYRVRARW